jgi:hypothetical protein
LTQPGRERGMGAGPRGGLAMLDREEKELYVGWTVILMLGVNASMIQKMAAWIVAIGAPPLDLANLVARIPCNG